MSDPDRRIVVHRAGSYQRLETENFTRGVLSADEVAVEVRAAGVNYADCMVRMGLYASAKEYVGWPITPGFEVSGVVVEVGSEVDDLEVGDEVVALTRFGGYTSLLVAQRAYVFRKPENVTFAEAAALPTIMATAWYALSELAHPRPGASILVHSAAGGVGTSLVQQAKIAGCEVTGVVGGSHKVPTAESMGCDHVIDKSTQDLWQEAERIQPGGFDVICDANGVDTLKQSYDHLARAGKLVVYGFHTMIPKKGGRPDWLKLASGWLRTPRFNPLDMTTASKSVLAFNLSYLFDRLDLLEHFVGDLQGWLADDLIQVPPVTTYPLEDAGRAHADLESAQTVGKLVLIP